MQEGERLIDVTAAPLILLARPAPGIMLLSSTPSKPREQRLRDQAPGAIPARGLTRACTSSYNATSPGIASVTARPNGTGSSMAAP